MTDEERQELRLNAQAVHNEFPNLFAPGVVLELLDELDRLVAQREEERFWRDEIAGQNRSNLRDLEEETIRLRKSGNVMRAALKGLKSDYHSPDCAGWENSLDDLPIECDCGTDALNAAIDAALEAEQAERDKTYEQLVADAESAVQAGGQGEGE